MVTVHAAWKLKTAISAAMICTHQSFFKATWIKKLILRHHCDCPECFDFRFIFDAEHWRVKKSSYWIPRKLTNFTNGFWKKKLRNRSHLLFFVCQLLQPNVNGVRSIVNIGQLFTDSCKHRSVLNLTYIDIWPIWTSDLY